MSRHFTRFLRKRIVTWTLSITYLCRWYLAEYDIDTFEMNETDKLYKTLKADASQDKDCVVPVEFNGGHKKEVEVVLQ